jgi:hypothetical protein
MNTKKIINFFMLSALACLLFLPASPGFGQDQAGSEGGVSIAEAVICRDVVDREPVGQGDVFSSDLKKVMCFTRVVGAEEDTEIVHNWYLGDKQMASVPLHVGSSNWRTYSSKTIIPAHAGEWKVEIMSQDGDLLKKIYFIIE